MTGSLAIAACVILVAASVQSATGFGISLIAAPLLYLLTSPAEAVALILVVAEVVNVLVLFGEGRRRRIDWGVVGPVLLAAAPGLPVGALIVRLAPVDGMKLVVGGCVCAIVLHRLLRRPAPAPPGRARPHGTLAAGLAVGVLTTSTTTNGPPLAILLTGRSLEPAIVRDSVTAIFAVLDLVGLAVLLAVGGTADVRHPGWLVALVPCAAAGHVLGRRIFTRIPAHRYAPIVLTIALAAGCLSIGSVFV